MIKLQESVLSLVRSSPLSAGIKNYLQDDHPGNKTLGGILSDTRFGWLAVGPRLCVLDLKTGQKVAAWTFGTGFSVATIITCVCELVTPLAENTRQLVVSLACEDAGGLICVFHCNGSQVLRCIQTEAVVSQLSVAEHLAGGPLACCDVLLVAGTERGELLAFDLDRAGLVRALKHSSQGYEHLIKNEQNMANLEFLSLDDIALAEEKREIALETEDHLAFNLNDQSYIDGEYIFRNPDGTVRMKAKSGHVRVTTLLYVPQLGSVVVGYNFGGFQIWNLMTVTLEYTSAVNVECLPVTHFGFQEPCDDPRAFCYLWVTYSVSERLDEEDFPLAVMYSLTYQGKRMLTDTRCLYQDFVGCTLRFQLELTCPDGTAAGSLLGGRCVACHTYSVPSSLHNDGDENVLNICQLVWECWSDAAAPAIAAGRAAPRHLSMLLFDLDQWYKDQMPESWRLQNSAFMCVSSCDAVCGGGGGAPLDLRLAPATLAPYTHVHRLEEHFYPNSLQYSCVCLTCEEASILWTAGVQRQILSGMDEAGPTVLLQPTQLFRQCVAALPAAGYLAAPTPCTATEQRKYLLSVALEGRLDVFLKRCARAWAGGCHSGAGCTLQLLLDWAWERALELKGSARDHMRAHDRNSLRCLEHCVRQLTQLASLLDSVVTKCCNLVVPDALSEMEERCKAISTVATYFQVVQWFLVAGLLPGDAAESGGGERPPYPRHSLVSFYQKRRIKLRCLDGSPSCEDNVAGASCPLLYIDQLIEHECGGDLIHDLWRSEDGESDGLYPPPSLHALLRVYLLPDVPDEHKHSLVLYLLRDYSTTFSDERYEPVIRRLMQFPTMFGLSNTAIKATQAFWHLDHRNFDGSTTVLKMLASCQAKHPTEWTTSRTTTYALDQLQCLTGNTLSGWQHSVVLSALLAQKRTQAALQYLHVRKPPPVQPPHERGVPGTPGTAEHAWSSRANDRDKLQDWQTCSDLYLARGLVFEAMDVIRLCVQSVPAGDKAEVLNFFFRGCKRTGQLSKILQITLLPLEEEMFIKYLQSSGDGQCADILVMYYLQQSRYLEAQRYNDALRRKARGRRSEWAESPERAADGGGGERDCARDAVVDVACAALPHIANEVAGALACAAATLDATPRVVRPVSVFVQAKSPTNTLVYKSSFIQNTIESASETWVRRPQLARGLKRALDIEETPFICTPKLSRKSRNIFNQSEDTSDMSVDGHSPAKRARLEPAAAGATPPRTPRRPPAAQLSARLSRDVQSMLDIPQVDEVSDWKIHSSDCLERSAREATPHSILKVRRALERGREREQSSPVDSLYLVDTDDELETASRTSNLTHCSDATNKQLRFAIPSSSNSSTPTSESQQIMTEESAPPAGASAARDSTDGIGAEELEGIPAEATPQRTPSVSPVYRQSDDFTPPRRSYKDNVKGRRSFSISANSSLNDDLHASIESIADIPVMLINPRYSGEASFTQRPEATPAEQASDSTPHITINDSTFAHNVSDEERGDSLMSLRTNFTSTPRTPRRRPSIKSGSSRLDSPAAGRVLRSQSRTPERESIFESPSIISASPGVQRTRTRSKTPELRGKSLKDSPKLESIPEVAKEQDTDKEMAGRNLRTPEKLGAEPPEAAQPGPLLESPSDVPEVKSDSPVPSVSPFRRSQRSRSKTPEVENSPKTEVKRSLRGGSKTPEILPKYGSPKLISIEKPAKSRKSLSRIVLEANTFSKISKTKIIDCGPGESSNSSKSKIVSTESSDKSVLEDHSVSVIESTPMKNTLDNATMAAYEFSPIIADQSILCSFPDSIVSVSPETPDASITDLTTPKSGTPFSGTFFDKSVLGGYRTSLTPSDSESNSPTEMDMPEPKLLEYNVSPIDPLGLGNESVLKDISTGVSAGSGDNSALTDDLSATSDSRKDGSVDENTAIASDKITKISARDIESEKKKIVEIEREINEIEDGMCEDGSDNRSGQENSNSDEDSGESDSEVDESDSTAESDSDNELEGLEGREDNINEQFEDSSNGEANRGVCVDDSEVISLVDSSDDDQGTPAKQRRKSKSSQSSDSFELQIDADSDIETDSPKDEINEANIGSCDEILKHQKKINDPAQLNTSFSESTKDGSGMIDKEHDPFMNPTSEIDKQSDTDSVPKVHNPDISQPEESSTAMDAFNEGNYSLITEDNSVLDTDRSDIDVSMGVPEAKHQTIKENQETDLVVPAPKNEDVSIFAATDNQKDQEPINQDEAEKVEVASPIKVVVTSTDGTDNVEIESKDFVDNAVIKDTDKIIPPEGKTVTEQQIKISVHATRKRTKSTNSNSSKKSDKAEEKVISPEKENPEGATEPGPFPIPSSSRKRSVSINAEKSEDFNSPKTPTRGRSKDKSVNLDDTTTTTPLRRSTRRSSKLSEDDNVSVTSGTSVKSSLSKTSKTGDGESVKSAGSKRKSRRSILMATKPDLSVIPEVEDSGASRIEDASQMIQEYSATRRLTRHQRSLLEKSMEPPRARAGTSAPRRPSVTSSVASLAGSEHSSELEEASVKSELFPVQRIDPISLLSKEDFDGPLDIDEELTFVSDQVRDSPDVSKKLVRSARAASETGSIKELKKIRRMSVDLERVSSPAPSLDGSLTGSPGRPRRTSFNKALEALSTPKRTRRLSSDVREGDADSVSGSPQAGSSKDVTPSRRSRRTPSLQSETAAAPAATRSPARRTRRNSSIAEKEDE